MKKRSLNQTLAVFAVFMLSFFLQPEKAEAAGVTELTIGDEDILTDADHTIQCGGGTAVYDPAADTLTLNNATIDCTFGQADSTSTSAAKEALIYSVRCRVSRRAQGGVLPLMIQT